MHLPRPGRRLRLIVLLAVVVGLAALSWLPLGPTATSLRQTGTDSSTVQFDPSLARPSDSAGTPTEAAARTDNDNEAVPPGPNPKLMAQAKARSDLDAFANDASGAIVPPGLRTRAALLAARAQARQAHDTGELARLNAVLATEAFERAARVTTRWLDRRDATSGLFPHTLRPKDRYWTYGDVGSDLFPFLTIAASQLLPGRYPELLDTLSAERRLNPGLPRDLMLDTLQPRSVEPGKQILGDVEYVKDGLLPLLEELGPDPWLGRAREVVEAVLTTASTPTPRGPIPSDAAEVNGSLLQALARLSWADPNPRYLEMGRRIAAVYLDDALPATGQIPPQHWDFMRQQAVGDHNLHLGDHGDEIVSGLIEWQRVEARLSLPERAAHRDAINRMLDRLLETGRTPDGLWYDGIGFPSGAISDHTLNDNWGYLGQAYLNQAASLRASPDGDREAAERYEQATAQMLTGVTGRDFYTWERGDMDGYADTLESALYLLRYLDDAAAAAWVDEQMAVLYGFQRDNGIVTDENIDGNFIRTVMLYGRWLTQGTRIEPWSPGVGLGAARDGSCLELHVHASGPWSGRLRFDTPRHSELLGLDTDYPRLNQWQEWWVAEPGHQYAVTLADGSSADLDGRVLAAGLPLSLEPERAYRLRVCPR